ncbi:MAG TPA: TPM domain-containing protein [Candidatus Limnocylindrales bacterium]|nr:TPM domain-containing protein [Candidatus Limnocylindrales bacterium]
MIRALRGQRGLPAVAVLAFAILVFATLVARAIAVPAGARAEAVPRLTSQVTDTTGVLAADRGAIDAALADLRSRAGVQLWVVFVRTTGSLSPASFVDQAAEQNSLGVDDALLLVALDDRTDQIWVSDGLQQLTNDEIDVVISRDLEPNLSAGHFGDAVVATAGGLRDAALGNATAGPGTTPESGLSLSPIIGLLLLLAGAWIVWRSFSSWRANRRTAEERDRQTGQLARDANAKLIAADDAVRDAQQDLAFAEAQFGEDEVAPLRAAIETARAELSAAFAVRQKLDDDVPEDPPTRAAMFQDVAARSDRATAAIAAEAKRIDDLRRIERDAPAIIPTLGGRADELEARMAAARDDAEVLGRFADPATGPVRGNVVEAGKRIASARQAAQAAQTALAADDKATAGRDARLAYEALAEADRLLTAVHRARQATEEDAAAAPRELATATTELAQAQAAGKADPRLAQAQAGLATAQSGLSAARRDPTGARRAIAAARAQIAAVDEAVRVAAQQRAAAAQTAAQTVQRAAALVDQAEDFIATRRAAVDRLARTQLATAIDRLSQAQALLPTDPATAQARATDAARYAEAALSAAQDDLSRFDRSAGYGRSGGAADALGAALPWILPWVIRGGAGWGGSSWGSSRGGGGIFGGGFGGGGGGMGGGGRTFGGGFGGGRSRGGRW